MRQRGVDVNAGKLRITNFTGSDQEKDFTEPSNCSGFGRVRHFRRQTSEGWPENPLPIDPAIAALGIDRETSLLKAQVFQNAVCNWRCWYCFVDFSLLSGSPEHSTMLSPADLVTLYVEEEDPPAMIDLSGGQPDLVPEWAPWMLQALKDRGLDKSVYLWSDDNLSNDYFWRYLTPDDRDALSTSDMYGKVCCFKGFDSHSFAFNTAAAPELFQNQLELMRRLITETAIDLYAYATFTSDQDSGIDQAVTAFVDQLQDIDPNLPLRTIPLEISPFTPVLPRMKESHKRALAIQQQAISAWSYELSSRFGSTEMKQRICDVPLRKR